MLCNMRPSAPWFILKRMSVGTQFEEVCNSSKSSMFFAFIYQGYLSGKLCLVVGGLFQWVRLTSQISLSTSHFVCAKFWLSFFLLII